MRYLIFNNVTEAQKRNREMMDATRSSDNIAGDGKPYVTVERYTMRIAKDGQTVLEIRDASQLTLAEKQALIEIRPSKFDPLEKDLFDER